MSIADFSVGSYMLRYIINEHQDHRLIWAEELKNFPRIQHWCDNTIAPNF